MNITYRKIAKAELYFLKEMLYEALFVAEGKPKLPKSIVDSPEISKYISDWNWEKDKAIVAIVNEQLVAAIWGRTFKAEQKGYGFVDSKTPEISMAVKAAYRNLGIGTALLKHIELVYQQFGVTQLSLSVDKLNPAIELYKRNGYQFYEDGGTAVTLRKKISNG